MTRVHILHQQDRLAKTSYSTDSGAVYTAVYVATCCMKDLRIKVVDYLKVITKVLVVCFFFNSIRFDSIFDNYITRHSLIIFKM